MLTHHETHPPDLAPDSPQGTGWTRSYREAEAAAHTGPEVSARPPCPGSGKCPTRQRDPEARKLSYWGGSQGTGMPLHRPDPFFLLPSATLDAVKTAGESELTSGKQGREEA